MVMFTCDFGFAGLLLVLGYGWVFSLFLVFVCGLLLAVGFCYVFWWTPL